MGIKLMVEVLDHYHGPDHKFRWLIAFTESAKDETRTGWPPRKLMVQRTGRSPGRVSNIGSELVADGILRRERGGGRNRGSSRYTLLPFAAQSSSKPNSEDAAQSSPSTNSDSPPQGSPYTNSDDDPQGSPYTNYQGSPYTNPEAADAVLTNPQITLTPPGGAQPAPTAQQILGAFIDWDRANGGTLTRRVTGQLAKIIATLLAEGISDRYIRSGLAAWREKEMHPSTLDSFVNAAMNGQAAGRRHRPSTGDRAIAEGEALKAQLRNRRELA